MSMEINGAAILSALATNPKAFAMTQQQLNTMAMTLVLAKLKDKAADLAVIRSVASAIGHHDFGIALDSLPAKDVAAVLKRLDAKHPDLKTLDETGLRAQIAKLAEGTAEPFTAAAPVPKAKPVKAPAADKPSKAGKVLKSKALKARPSGK